MHPDIAIFSPLGRGGSGAHGGITPIIECLTRAFCDRGLDIELVSIARGDPRALAPGLDPRATIHDLGPGGRRVHHARLRTYLHERRPRALLAAGHRANLITVAAARTRGLAADGIDTRIVLGVHNALSPGLRELGPLRRRLRLLALRRAYPQADALICVSEGVAADLANHVTMPPQRLHVIHNPITAADEAAKGIEDASIHRWLAPDQPPVILGAGRLTRQKAFGTLIKAFALLRDLPEHRLIIVGEGSERSALQRLAAELGVAERTDLPGFVANPRAHMARAALFVLSSDWEGFGNVLVEAMSVGTPVVSTDCPSGPREILRDGALGPLVPPGNPAALATAMRSVLAARPIDADRLKARALDFAPAGVAARYLKVLVPGALQ
jgi:glycosyltransferase involved in cell wall biosynthesis